MLAISNYAIQKLRVDHIVVMGHMDCDSIHAWLKANEAGPTAAPSMPLKHWLALLTILATALPPLHPIAAGSTAGFYPLCWRCKLQASHTHITPLIFVNSIPHPLPVQLALILSIVLQENKDFKHKLHVSKHHVDCLDYSLNSISATLDLKAKLDPESAAHLDAKTHLHSLTDAWVNLDCFL
ncbi:hypothetical protein HETIRDRAFT_447221 [Heterobasidion irregulare TC 32-1]|uniref:Carbonic anhydrase n=1 Tax=Heterobasidion irregulare (strain TC 32-1) TaxID=747525 RepID=W4KL82_HETIT|nr:uncharacterized protein HETIRDRAFT_447221 [Heterobasidion irregulare TC 32-1]ETW86464.1 hypothetical protein HETIRDRAFT_447221 [Heterobasidion irregulare TC 32-1]